ncbi:photosynthetic complex assembly protein PuhC [uncultured Erythrobacter sp.]|uniref:photosynthetic complex assembly protein PuhC n=1 Tax=uncultured Erythrobacter sp. TaxID=263913 RepID=UPI00261F8E67|nr:photosynthetic complex assembly protein PuhC [uncultured Erythrobacter sp.]
MIVREYEEDEITVHRFPLLLMGGLIAITLALTSAVSFGFFERQAIPSEARAASGATATATRSLLFFDERDGTVRVEDAASREEIARFGPGTGGFVRTTVRSLVYQRRVNGIGRSVPFELIEWDNNMLTLRDTTTGESVELGSFGKGNRTTFANFLENRSN